MSIADNALSERETLIRVFGSILLAIERDINIDHRVKRRNSPVTAEREMCACVFQVTPWKGNMPALRTSTLRPDHIFFTTERCVTGLHGSNNTQLLETWHILRLTDFNMFNAVT